MSAAATAAGYLYASGRLHGAHKRELDSKQKRAQNAVHAPARNDSGRIQQRSAPATVPSGAGASNKAVKVSYKPARKLR